MSLITNLCTQTNVKGVGSSKAVNIPVSDLTNGAKYVVNLGKCSGDVNVGFGDTTKQWDGKPFHATANQTRLLFLRALTGSETVDVSGIIVCSAADWQRLQQLGLTFFDGDLMPQQ